MLGYGPNRPNPTYEVSRRMAHIAKKPATYADLEAVPPRAALSSWALCPGSIARLGTHLGVAGGAHCGQ